MSTLQAIKRILNIGHYEMSSTEWYVRFLFTFCTALFGGAYFLELI